MNSQARTSVLRGIACSALAAFLAIACSSRSGATPFCADTEHTCQCDSTTFELSSHASVVSDCDDSLSSAFAWACEYDVDASGETSDCNCSAYACIGYDPVGGAVCTCGYGYEPSASTSDCTAVAADGDSPEIHCCAMTTPSDEFPCSCGPWECSSDWFPPGSVDVPSCSLTAPAVALPATTSTGKHVAPTCAGLDWAPSTSSGSSSGSTTDDACQGGCGGCSYCSSTGCVACPIGDEGICTC